MGTPLGPKYIPYTYMDPLGIFCGQHIDPCDVHGFPLGWSPRFGISPIRDSQVVQYDLRLAEPPM